VTDFAYASDLSGGSLMVRESRIVAALLLESPTDAAWQQAIVTDNILQKRASSSARRNAQAIRKRLQHLTPDFLRALRDGDDELATQIAFCATLLGNLLLVEFIERVVLDAYTTHTEKLDQYQWFDFLDESAHRDPSISSWTESSRKKMREVAFRILREVGYIPGPRDFTLQRVVIRPEVITMLDDHDLRRIKACMEVSTRSARTC
jgi:hypothetical protein